MSFDAVVVGQNSITRLDEELARATLEQCPSFSLYWALCAPQSGPTGIWRLRTWRSDSNSPCSAAGRSDYGSGRWIAPSGSGSLGVGLGGARRSTSFAPRR